MYVVTIGQAKLGEMDEWSRHRTLSAAVKEAKKMASTGHRRVAQGAPQLATIWASSVWDRETAGSPLGIVEVQS